MKESDIKHLNWIYEQLITYMRKQNHRVVRFKSIIDELEKENMPKLKQFRLEIPKIITLDQFGEIAKAELSANWLYDNIGIIFDADRAKHIPNFLLIPIEEKPMTSEEAYEIEYPDGSTENVKSGFMKGVARGVEIESSKHKETKSCEEAWRKTDLPTDRIAPFLKGWNAALKSRGYE